MGISSNIHYGKGSLRSLLRSLLLVSVLIAAQHANAETREVCAEELTPIWVEGGRFEMGSDQTYREESGTIEVVVSDFWMDPTEVTVSDFEKFVTATGYVTVAERGLAESKVDPEMLKAHPEYAELMVPGGAVFKPDSRSSLRDMNWWAFVPGASWRYPQGPSAGAAQPSHPVTQIAYQDAAEYAAWVGGRLPSEAEWEYAALGDRTNSDFGATPPPNANTWQGIFPIVDTAEDGFANVAPVGCFAPNPKGLYDMLGNVWEWTADQYAPGHSIDRVNPSEMSKAKDGASLTTSSPPRVIKGGSSLCAPNYCRRYRPAARQPQETGLGTNHIGFRVVYDSPSRKDARAKR